MNAMLSIIVPIYNVSRYLVQCVDSILNQTFKDFELILVDDGSTDNSGKICDEYANKDSRIIVIHKKNGGCVSARKTGLLAAKGKYAAYVDSDDFIEPDMFETIVTAMEKYGCDFAFCDFDYENKALPFSSGLTDTNIDGGFYGREKLESEIFPRMLYSGEFYKFGIYPVIWSKVYRREKLIKFQLNVWDEIKTGEDVACVYPYLLSAESMYYAKGKPLYHYRRSSSQMTTAYDSAYFDSIRTLYAFLSQSPIAKSPYSEQLNYYFTYVSKLSISNEIKSKRRLTFGEKIKHIKEICAFVQTEGFAEGLNIKEPHHRIYIHLMQKGRAFSLCAGISVIKFIQKLAKR